VTSRKEKRMITETTIDTLLQAAKLGMQNAFTGTNQKDAPRFGAALITTKGNIYSSGQYYSDTLSLTLHAEQAALAHAAAHGEYAITAITCVGNNEAYQLSKGLIYPCHLCKQLIWESSLRSGINTEIYVVDTTDTVVERLRIQDIMKYPWPQK
jgi:cytidine deaminase